MLRGIVARRQKVRTFGDIFHEHTNSYALINCYILFFWSNAIDLSEKFNTDNSKLIGIETLCFLRVCVVC